MKRQRVNIFLFDFHRVRQKFYNFLRVEKYWDLFLPRISPFRVLPSNCGCFRNWVCLGHLLKDISKWLLQKQLQWSAQSKCIFRSAKKMILSAIELWMIKNYVKRYFCDLYICYWFSQNVVIIALHSCCIRECCWLFVSAKPLLTVRLSIIPCFFVIFVCHYFLYVFHFKRWISYMSYKLCKLCNKQYPKNVLHLTFNLTTLIYQSI